MPTKTVVVHLPKSTGNSNLNSPNGFTSNSLKSTMATTITTMSIPTPKSASTSLRANTIEAVEQRRSSTLRKRSDRRVKALSVGHISPNTSPMHAPPGLDLSYDGSSIRSEFDGRGIDERVFGGAGVQPIPTPTATGGAPPKQSYMARVANGLGFMSKVSEEKNQKDKEPSSSSLPTKGLGLGLGAGILFGASAAVSSQLGTGTGGGESTRRSRSKSNSSRPGTAAGLITTTSTTSTSTIGSTNIKPKVLDVDKPLPSCPASSSNTINRRYSLRAEGAQTPFGTPGSYSLLFVDHELESLTYPPRPNSAVNFINGRPRSISTSAGGTPATTRPPSVVNVGQAGVSMKLEPIIPVHVLDQMVSASPQEMSPGATQRYFPLSTQGHGKPAAGGILQRRESSRSRKSERLGRMGSGEDLARSVTPVQDAEMVIRARSLSRSNSTTVRTGTSYPRRPSKSSSLRREMRAESPSGVEESIRSCSTSRPGTSGSMYTAVISRSNSTVSRRQLAVESEEEEEEERRGRGRSPGGRKGLRRFNSVEMEDRRQQFLGLEDNLSRIVENGPGDQYVQEQGKEGSRVAGDIREVTKRVTALARKPVPVPTRPGPRNPSRSTSRSRSRSKSSRMSRPTSPERGTINTTMNTINEVQTTRALVGPAPRPRILDLDRNGKSRTPSPLRPTTGAHASGSSSSLRAKYQADEGRPPAHMASNVMRSPVLSSIPKRKPVPQGYSPTALRPPSALPAPPPQLLRPKNPMIVAIPPTLGSMRTESPISGGGKSTAGLMSSEDEEDPMKTPMTATFSFVTPLLPSPPKRPALQTAVSSPLAESIQSETSMVACEPQQVQDEKPLDADVSNRILQNVNVAMAFPPTPPKSSFTPPIGGMRMQIGHPHPFSPQVSTVSSTSASSSPMSISPQTPQSSLSPAIQVLVHEPPADHMSVDITCSPTPPTVHHSPASTPAPASPVSPISPTSFLYPPPTISDSPTPHLLELQRQELLLERTRWESEHYSLQSTLTTLSQENQKLKDLVFKLTETVERQDMELRKHQQHQHQQRARAIPKTLPLGGGGATGAARAGLPQGWSVFTNPRTPPPPKPKTRTESSESGVSQVSMLENKGVSANLGYGGDKPVGHRRGSVSMSTRSSALSSPPPAPPGAPLGLKKGFSHSLPLLNAGTSTQKGAPVVSLSTAVGGAEEVRRELPMKKGPPVQGEAEKGIGMGSDATVAAGRSPKARALWKRTTAAVAGGRKAQGKWGGKM